MIPESISQINISPSNDGNSMVYDSMMNKINPRTLGAVGNRANLENDSIAKYAKQINKSGPVNSNTQSRIEQ